MLAVAVKLNRNVVTMLQRIAVARLHTTAYAEIDRYVQIIGLLLPQNRPCIIAGTVINDNIICTRDILFNVLYCADNVILLVVGGDNNQ